MPTSGVKLRNRILAVGEASCLVELSQISTLKITCGRRTNVSRELTSAESPASMKKSVAKGSRREGEGAKRRATASASKHCASSICLFFMLTGIIKIKDRNGCAVVVLVHSGSTRNSRRVILSSDLHSVSVLMAQMETDPPDITKSCEERNRLSLEIEALDIVINRCTELVNFLDTDDITTR
ncbi:hypothetical protein TNCV_2500511 [Trichonephila clavipes]|nr:hypothetical protein TNCV_2500511 [Trichonephila clavipes]